ncbi:MAG: endo alpha-1,4 polygalactosaminidase [Acidimicrobiales bacterium]
MPSQTAELQWEISDPLVTTDAALMGTGIIAYNGDGPAITNPTVYDIDAFENTASTVSALHALGDKAICYIEVGSAGNYYPASEEGISTTYYAQLSAAGDLGDKLSGYPEYFLNINCSSTVSIIEAMIDQQCAAKHFDAVETDLDETFSGNEHDTVAAVFEYDVDMALWPTQLEDGAVMSRFVAMLAERGRNGWELAATLPASTPDKHWLIFKRTTEN